MRDDGSGDYETFALGAYTGNVRRRFQPTIPAIPKADVSMIGLCARNGS